MNNLKNIKANFKNAKSLFNKNIKENIEIMFNNWNNEHNDYVAEVVFYSYSGRKINTIGVRKNNICSTHKAFHFDYKFNDNCDYNENVEMLKNYLNKKLERCYIMRKYDVEKMPEHFTEADIINHLNNK
jgi:hypothetical protein